MADALKHLYDRSFVRGLAAAIKERRPTFDATAFVAAVFDGTWDQLALKARMRHISTRLGEHLPGTYASQLAVLRRVAPGFTGFTAMVFPDFVEVHGLHDPERSLDALELFTRFSSSEFAVRPFIVRHEAAALARLRSWAGHENEHVRRLASEGCRPRLPWAMALPRFKADPSPILPILEMLRADPSAYVRRSVANNLNDIAKDHPDVTLDVARRWYGVHPPTDALLKHACRTLLKRGDPRALAVFGYSERAPAAVESFSIVPRRVRIGGVVELAFVVAHAEPAPVKLRVEYHVHFVRASGGTAKKVFQVAERVFAPGQHAFARRHAFRDLSTRVHYPGVHRIGIALNGTEQASAEIVVSRRRGH